MAVVVDATDSAQTGCTTVPRDAGWLTCLRAGSGCLAWGCRASRERRLHASCCVPIVQQYATLSLLIFRWSKCVNTNRAVNFNLGSVYRACEYHGQRHQTRLARVWSLTIYVKHIQIRYAILQNRLCCTQSATPWQKLSSTASPHPTERPCLAFCHAINLAIGWLPTPHHPRPWRLLLAASRTNLHVHGFLAQATATRPPPSHQRCGADRSLPCPGMSLPLCSFSLPLPCFTSNSSGDERAAPLCRFELGLVRSPPTMSTPERGTAPQGNAVGMNAWGPAACCACQGGTFSCSSPPQPHPAAPDAVVVPVAELEANAIDLTYRDYCAHLLIPLNK